MLVHTSGASCERVVVHIRMLLQVLCLTVGATSKHCKSTRSSLLVQMRVVDSGKAKERAAEAHQLQQPEQQQATNGALISNDIVRRPAVKALTDADPRAIDTDHQQKIASLINRLQLLQDVGCKFAQRLHLTT